MWREVRYGFRKVGSRKLFGATIVLLLSIGIGVNTLVFSFMNALLLTPLPLRNPESATIFHWTATTP